MTNPDLIAIFHLAKAASRRLLNITRGMPGNPGVALHVLRDALTTFSTNRRSLSKASSVLLDAATESLPSRDQDVTAELALNLYMIVAQLNDSHPGNNESLSWRTIPNEILPIILHCQHGANSGPQNGDRV